MSPGLSSLALMDAIIDCFWRSISSCGKSRQGQNFSQEFQPRGQIFLEHGHAHIGKILTATRGKVGADKIQGIADLQRGSTLCPIGQEPGG